jgi:hypothetical protein
MIGDKVAPAPALDPKALQKERTERFTRMMWAYVCGGITVMSYLVGFEASFIPLGFGVLGCVLAWQLMKKGEPRHGSIAGALNLGGMMIWLTYNWSVVERYIGH